MNWEHTSTSKLRTEIIEKLKYNYAHGNLEEEEFDSMLSEATNADTKDSLIPIYTSIADMPMPVDNGNSSQDVIIRKKTATMLNILSGVERRGVWNVPKHIKMYNILGGATVDLSQCNLNNEETVIDLVCVLGGAEIIVPDDADVVVEGIPVLGGIEDSTNGGNGPRIHIRSIIALGGAEIRSLNKKERRKLKRYRK